MELEVTPQDPIVLDIGSYGLHTIHSGFKHAIKATEWKDCATAYKTFCEKVFEKSPLKFQFTKGISCLDPSVIINSTIADKRLSVCLEIMVSNNWITGIKTHGVKESFKVFIGNPVVQKDMEKFKREKERLDDVFFSLFEVCNSPNNLWSFVKIHPCIVT
ncbi:hypothetical protein AVEN_121488-1 [Araneus ventricosus]|uniref:Uncharacterized protein n=1 Tax=Araneus ventricosus TaxID=182803 RepID=A0A4Y2K6W9_ARAVE|nr:hypothetical protein AVEN_121488-1 [Araneus ventricosus]